MFRTGFQIWYFTNFSIATFSVLFQAALKLHRSESHCQSCHCCVVGPITFSPKCWYSNLCVLAQNHAYDKLFVLQAESLRFWNWCWLQRNYCRHYLYSKPQFCIARSFLSWTCWMSWTSILSSQYPTLCAISGGCHSRRLYNDQKFQQPYGQDVLKFPQPYDQDVLKFPQPETLEIWMAIFFGTQLPLFVAFT